MGIKTGDPATDFTLPAWVDGAATTVTLSEQRGTPVVLAFYPGDDSSVCTRQLCGYQDDLSTLTGSGAVLWGISAEDLGSHESFARRQGLTFPLLSDVDKAVHRQYGAASNFGLRRRVVLVIDAAGIVVWQRASVLGQSYEDSATLAGVLGGLR
jgi:peroxiredoxin Q/BCP